MVKKLRMSCEEVEVRLVLVLVPALVRFDDDRVMVVEVFEVLDLVVVDFLVDFEGDTGDFNLAKALLLLMAVAAAVEDAG